MRRHRVIVLFCGFCSLMSSQAHAQARPLILVHSGATVPTADYGALHGVGPNAGAGLEFEIRHRLALQGTVEYYSLPVLHQRGRESGLVATGNLKWFVLPEGAIATPYVLAGLGVWRTGFSDVWVSTDGVSPRPGREGQEESRFAVNFGAGAIVPLRERVGLFGQARYVMVSTDESRIRMVPIELGFTYSRR